MYQATTPGFRFILPFTTDIIDKFLISFRQGFTLLDFANGSPAVEVGVDTLTVSLTQEQANLFAGDRICKVQVRIKKTDGTVVASQVEDVFVNLSLNLEVL